VSISGNGMFIQVQPALTIPTGTCHPWSRVTPDHPKFAETGLIENLEWTATWYSMPHWLTVLLSTLGAAIRMPSMAWLTNLDPWSCIVELYPPTYSG
jgi:hypothetical protein